MLTKINRMKRQKGFTLVELLLVVAILAVLAFLAVPAIASTIRNSRIRTCASNEIMIEQAVWRWYSDVVAQGENQPFASQTISAAGVWEGAIEAAEGTPGPVAPYFRPSAAPSCPFGNDEGYVVYVSVVNHILEDVLVVCADGDEAVVEPPAAAFSHIRATERPRIADF